MRRRSSCTSSCVRLVKIGALRLASNFIFTRHVVIVSSVVLFAIGVFNNTMVSVVVKVNRDPHKCVRIRLVPLGGDAAVFAGREAGKELRGDDCVADAVSGGCVFQQRGR